VSKFCANCSAVKVRRTKTGKAVHYTLLRRDINYCAKLPDETVMKLIANDPSITAEAFGCPLASR
jgi:hypothetical protein